MVVAVCQSCGRTFSVRPSRYVDGKGRYCCRQCYFDAKRRYAFVKNCAYCGNIFYTTKNDARFCSRTCAGNAAAHRRCDVRRTGERYIRSSCSQRTRRFFDDPWASGAIGPDRYGRDLYRMPDVGLGF